MLPHFTSFTFLQHPSSSVPPTVSMSQLPSETFSPSASPLGEPSLLSSIVPSKELSKAPSSGPSDKLSGTPSLDMSLMPSTNPSHEPSQAYSSVPSTSPSLNPTHSLSSEISSLPYEFLLTEAPTSCIQCTDKVTPWMKLNEQECSTKKSIFEHKCKSSAWWTKNKFCQLSCFRSGNNYSGEYCCDQSKNVSCIPSKTPNENPFQVPSEVPTNPPTSKPTSCNSCTDIETIWMIKNNEDCTTSNLRFSRCNKSEHWTKNKHCQHSCFRVGNGYPGDNCCEGSSSPTSKPSPSCSSCTDIETEWMIKNNKDCTTSDLIFSKCKNSAYWTRNSHCQHSCFHVGNGYTGDECC